MIRLWLVIALILLTLLSLRFYFFYNNQPRYRDGELISFETTLLAEPKVSGRYQRFSVGLPNGERVFITAPRFPEFSYGQTLYISSALNKRVINNENTILTMSFPKIKAIKNGDNLGLALTLYIRQKIVSLYQKLLSPVASGLLSGIVFGIKTSMPAEFIEDLRAVGVMHVIAASGMNVTMVGGFLLSVFSMFRRQVALVFSIAGIVLYAALAGFEPSIVRASIMGSIAFSAQAFGRQYLAVLALFLTGFVMLFYFPPILLDIGFQLSFLATLGLITIPGIRAIRGIKVIGEDINTTIAAQAATLPILLANFGTYSLWSIFVNALLLWTIPLLMIIGAVAAIVGMVSEQLGFLPLYLSLPLLLYFEKTVSIFASFGGTVEINDLPWQLTIGYYALVVAGALYYLRSKN